MIEVRIHGRRGQGVVTAAELLSLAAFVEGRHAQAFPSSGSDHTGTPMVAFCRIDDYEIRTREPSTQPVAVIVEDPTLLGEVLDGLRDDGYLLINSGRRIDNLGLPPLTLRPERAIAVPATELARKLVGRPIPNAALLGGFAAMCEVVSLDSVLTAIQQRFAGPIGKANAAAALTAFAVVRTELEELAHA